MTSPIILSTVGRRSWRSPDWRAKPTASVHLYMSESENTGPCCSALLLPARRRKLFMRPLASSRSCMVGMLRVKLILRRGIQKPSLMVTAYTGMFHSLDGGDLVRFSTDLSCQGGVATDCTTSL